jgi:hypothetical protein
MHAVRKYKTAIQDHITQQRMFYYEIEPNVSHGNRQCDVHFLEINADDWHGPKDNKLQYVAGASRDSQQGPLLKALNFIILCR